MATGATCDSAVGKGRHGCRRSLGPSRRQAAGLAYGRAIDRCTKAHRSAAALAVFEHTHHALQSVLYLCQAHSVEITRLSASHTHTEHRFFFSFPCSWQQCMGLLLSLQPFTISQANK